MHFTPPTALQWAHGRLPEPTQSEHETEVSPRVVRPRPQQVVHVATPSPWQDWQVSRPVLLQWPHGRTTSVCCSSGPDGFHAIDIPEKLAEQIQQAPD